MSSLKTTSNNSKVIRSGSNLTTSPIIVANDHSFFEPEFAGYKEIRVIFGLSRTHLFRLAKEGKIKSVSLRDVGKVKGRRLYNIASIRALLHESGEEAVQTTEGVNP